MIKLRLQKMIFLINILISSFAFCSVQENVNGRVYVSPAVIYIGETIHYYIEVSAPSGINVTIPEISGNLAGFVVKDFSSQKEEDKNGIKTCTRNFELHTFLSGNYIIPPLNISYKIKDKDYTLTLPGLYVRVDSLLNPEENDIRDIASPKDYRQNKKWPKWSWWIIAACLVLACGIVFVVWRKKRKNEKIEIILPPWDIALRELEKLGSSGLLENDRFREYYYSLSDILRHYVEGRFGLMAPERTTEEFIKLMQESSHIGDSHKKLLHKFLLESDLVKFAKIKPDKSETDKGTATVRSFILETKVEENPVQKKGD